MRSTYALALASIAAACAPGGRDRNAEAVSGLPPAAVCEASLPFFGFSRYPGERIPQFTAPDGRIAMANDGGWCAIAYQVLTPAGHFATADARVSAPPAHGEARIGTVDGLLRIAYRPAPGYAGADAFAVRLDGPIGYEVPVDVRVR